MKQAGLKNDGAWFRMNRAIRHLTTIEQAGLTAILQELSYGPIAYNDLLSLATETGVDQSDFPSNFGGWISRLVTVGIPRQIWNGKLTFTTYTVSGEPGQSPSELKYAANYQSNIGKFAKELRRACANFVRGSRQVKDMFDMGDLSHGNPGGLPDGSKLT